MDQVFLSIVNLSIAAGWMILAVLLLRLVLKPAPRWVACLLWATVAIRLLLPISPESELSLIPSAETFPKEILLSTEPTLNSGIPVLNQLVNSTFTQHMAPNPGDSVNPLQVLFTLGGYLWLIGIAAMLLYMSISLLRIGLRVRPSLQLQGRIRLCDEIDTPFILGVLRPRIYLPSKLQKQDLPYVVAHEEAHLRRLDHLWKPLGYLILCVYWFHPLVWVAYRLFCRDVEVSCDEAVIARLGDREKKPYSQALLRCSLPRKTGTACTAAFGESSVKERVKHVLVFKKPSFWATLLAVPVLFVAALCLLTSPKLVTVTAPEEEPSAAISQTPLYSGIDENGRPWFNATVLDLGAGYMTVLPIDPNLPERIEVVKKLANGSVFPQGIENGDVVRITHNGAMTFTVIGQLNTVYEIRKIERTVLKSYSLSDTAQESIILPFTLTLYSDGSFHYYEGMLSSYMARGAYRVEGDQLIITDHIYPYENRFRMEAGRLVWLADGSTGFMYTRLNDGDYFTETP